MAGPPRSPPGHGSAHRFSAARAPLGSPRLEGIGPRPSGLIPHRDGAEPGVGECFHGAVLEDFFRLVMHQKLFESVEALQADPNAWLHHHSHERPHLGYRHQGRRPWETVERFVRQEG